MLKYKDVHGSGNSGSSMAWIPPVVKFSKKNVHHILVTDIISILSANKVEAIELIQLGKLKSRGYAYWILTQKIIQIIAITFASL